MSGNIISKQPEMNIWSPFKCKSSYDEEGNFNKTEKKVLLEKSMTVNAMVFNQNKLCWEKFTLDAKPGLRTRPLLTADDQVKNISCLDGVLSSIVFYFFL